MTNSPSLAVRRMEGLEVDMKEAVDVSEERLDLCWGTIMFVWVGGRQMVVWEQERMGRVTSRPGAENNVIAAT